MYKNTVLYFYSSDIFTPGLKLKDTIVMFGFISEKLIDFNLSVGRQYTYRTFSN